MHTEADNPNVNPAAGIGYEEFLRCIHCGLCTPTCPTYAEAGDENDGPRGRVQLMRMVADGQPLSDRMRRHLELCLDCRACETACPSGVRYGRLIEPFRLAVEQADRRVENRFDWFRELVLFRLFPYADRMRRLLTLVRLGQRTKVLPLAERLGLLRLVPGRLGRMARLLPAELRSGLRLPRFLPAVGRKRARVALFLGCVGDAIFRHVHWATVRRPATERLRRVRAARTGLLRSDPFPQPAIAAPRGRWPTPTWWPLSWTGTTRSSSTMRAAGP